MSQAIQFSRLLFGFVVVLFVARPLVAADFCVSTGNQLATAMTTAGSNAENDHIKIEFGTLTTNVQALENYQWIYNGQNDAHATTISGGWTKNNGCASIATQDPAATVLDAQYFGPVFLADLGIEYSGSFTMRNLTFARGKLFDFNCYSAVSAFNCVSGVAISAGALPGASVVLDNILIRHGVYEAGASGPVSSLNMVGGGILRLRNSIVMGNNLSSGQNTAGVHISAASNTIVYVTNNSIFGNTVSGNEAGLSVQGVVNLANNAVADNASSGAPVAHQFTARGVSSMTLRNNHFGNQQSIGGGFPSIDENTTTGDAQWTQTGVRMYPNTESVLRDSGINAPSGGLPSIDFSGKARIINTVIDRGATEADAVPPMGPSITPLSPLDGSTTSVFGSTGTQTDRQITFSTSGGTLGGSTSLVCAVISGSAEVLNNGLSIPTGGTAPPITVRIPITTTPTTHTVLCSFSREGASVGTYTFYFRAGAELLFSSSFE